MRLLFYFLFSFSPKSLVSYEPCTHIYTRIFSSKHFHVFIFSFVVHVIFRAQFFPFDFYIYKYFFVVKENSLLYQHTHIHTHKKCFCTIENVKWHVAIFRNYIFNNNFLLFPLLHCSANLLNSLPSSVH